MGVVNVTRTGWAIFKLGKELRERGWFCFLSLKNRENRNLKQIGHNVKSGLRIHRLLENYFLL